MIWFVHVRISNGEPVRTGHGGAHHGNNFNMSIKKLCTARPYTDCSMVCFITSESYIHLLASGRAPIFHRTTGSALIWTLNQLMGYSTNIFMHHRAVKRLEPGVWYGAAPGLIPAADSELDDWHCWTIVFQISCLIKFLLFSRLEHIKVRSATRWSIPSSKSSSVRMCEQSKFEGCNTKSLRRYGKQNGILQKVRLCMFGGFFSRFFTRWTAVTAKRASGQNSIAPAKASEWPKYPYHSIIK